MRVNVAGGASGVLTEARVSGVIRLLWRADGVGELLVRSEERGMWLGAAIAVVASLLCTTIAAALESSINGPGERVLAPPVLWGLGGGFGLVLGAVVAAGISRRVWPGIFAAFVGAIPWTILLIVAYNSGDLKTEDQIVGTLIVLVVPALIVASLCAVGSALVARLVARGRRGSTA
jgi:peptidoglycan/LPS O-acetylase OafA/YrhL